MDILSDICRRNVSQISSLKEKDPTFHWVSLSFPHTKETCLHLACQYGYIEIVKYLLTEFHPTAVDARNIDNKTPLHEAVQHGQYDCVKILILSGADINAIKRSDWTPLMLACTKSDTKYTEIVQHLLCKGALMNVQNKDGWTCIHIAARNPNSSILKLLLTRRDLNVTAKTKNGRNALHIAALHRNLENVKLLIGQIDANSLDSSGNTAFHEAVLGGDINVIDYLVTSGANVTVSNNIGLNAIHLAAGQGYDYIIRYLKEKYEFDINSTDFKGYTAVHHACKKGHKSTVDTLTSLGAQIDVTDNCGRLPRDYMVPHD